MDFFDLLSVSIFVLLFEKIYISLRKTFLHHVSWTAAIHKYLCYSSKSAINIVFLNCCFNSPRFSMHLSDIAEILGPI